MDGINKEMGEHFVNKIINHFHGDISKKTIAVLGLAFKPDTDDMREAPSLLVISKLLRLGAKVTVFDPIAMENAKTILCDTVAFVSDAYTAAVGADAVCIVTEWNEFKQLDLVKLAQGMKEMVLFDGRNIYEPSDVKKLGFAYYGVGRM